MVKIELREERSYYRGSSQAVLCGKALRREQTPFDERIAMHVGLIGDETVLGAAVEQLAACGIESSWIHPAAVETVDLVLAADSLKENSLSSVSEKTTLERIPFVSIELGGIGSHQVSGVDAAIGLFPKDGPEYSDLVTRVKASAPETDDAGIPPTIARVAGTIAGHEVTQHFATEDHPERVARVIELPYTERRLLEIPNPMQEDRWWGERGKSGRSIEEAVTAAELMVDERLGPVSTVGEVNSIPLPYYYAQLAETNAFSDESAAEHAASVAANWNEALLRAVGESLERYAAGIYRTDGLQTARPADLSMAIPPEAFIRPEHWDSVVSEIPWVPARRLDTGDRNLVPAELTFFPPPSRKIRPAITTGLGLGNTLEEAIVSGLTEVIERDAAMLSWYSSFEPLELAVHSEEYRHLKRCASVVGLSTTTVLLTQDIDVPVVGAAVHRTGSWPRFAIGSAADVDIVTAAVGALREAIQNWMELDHMGEKRATAEAERIASYAANPDKLTSWLSSTTSASSESFPDNSKLTTAQQLETLLTQLDASTLRPFAVRLTTNDLATVGFEAVRVLIPEAQPLFTGDPYFGSRATQVPVQLGYTPELQRDAHPFP